MGDLPQPRKLETDTWPQNAYPCKVSRLRQKFVKAASTIEVLHKICCKYLMFNATVCPAVLKRVWNQFLWVVLFQHLQTDSKAMNESDGALRSPIIRTYHRPQSSGFIES